MSRPISQNPKDKAIQVKMDAKLYAQLMNYAKRNDRGNVSKTARRALEQFILENNL